MSNNEQNPLSEVEELANNVATGNERLNLAIANKLIERSYRKQPPAQETKEWFDKDCPVGNVKESVQLVPLDKNELEKLCTYYGQGGFIADRIWEKFGTPKGYVELDKELLKNFLTEEIRIDMSVSYGGQGVSMKMNADLIDFLCTIICQKFALKADVELPSEEEMESEALKSLKRFECTYGISQLNITIRAIHSMLKERTNK